MLKRDLKAGGIAPAGFEALAADRSGWRYTTESAIKTAEQERSSGKKRELAGAREQRQIQHPWMTMSSHAATVTGSAVRGSASTATAGASTLPRTDIYRRELHCLSRQTDANKKFSYPEDLESGIGEHREATDDFM